MQLQARVGEVQKPANTALSSALKGALITFTPIGFFVIEGLDGSGKSTQSRLLHEHLSKRHKAVLTTEPTDGFIGKQIRELLRSGQPLDPETRQLMFVADRANHVNTFIKPMIAKGNIVVSDRYFFSTIAYGVATGLDKSWIMDMHRIFPMPDATFVIDLDPKTALERIARRGQNLEIFEKVALQTKIRAEYLALQKNYKRYFIIDGNRDAETISKEIIGIAEKILANAPIV